MVYRKPDEPDYLFLYLKVKDLEFKKLRAIYAMHWEHKGVSYAAGVHTHTFGEYQVFIAGNSDDHIYLRINGDFDLENNIVFFKVPKILIGSPEQGDILTSTDAWTALRYRAELLTLLHGEGELIKDWAGYGRDYTIQYKSIGVPYMHRIFGPASLLPGFEMEYSFEATDPQGEDIYFYIDWGDGSIEDWVGPFSSGDPEQFIHTWEDQGSYTIKAKAKDTNGYESDLVEFDLTVTNSRTKSVMLENFLNRFPLIKQIIKTILNRPLLL